MLIAIFLCILIPPIWLSFHVIKKKNIPLLLRIAIILALFVISQIFTIDSFLFGNLSGPQMPRNLLLFQGFALASEIICFLFVFIFDIVRFASYIFKNYKAKKTKNLSEDEKANLQGQGSPKEHPDLERRAFLRKTFATSLYAATPIVGVGLGAAGAEAGVALPIVHKVSIKTDLLPASFEGLRIAHISDIHIATLITREWMRSLVRLVNKETPDIICITGDLSDGLPGYRSPDGWKRFEVAEELGDLYAPLGIWACTGNHEYYSDYAGWMRVYSKAGIRFLHDTSTTFAYKDANFVLAGRDDRQAARSFGQALISARDVFRNTSENSRSAVRILLDHRPERCRENALEGCVLQLSGHTHGGQCLGMDRVVAMANQGFVRGLYQIDKMALYVSSGAGLWNGFPIRLGVPAEIALITLTHA